MSFVLKSKLLEKYFNNGCTSKEIDTLFNWLLGNIDLAEKEHIINNQWEKSVSTATPEEHAEIQQRLDKIHHKINLSWQDYHSEGRNKSKVRTLEWWKLAYRAAVIILLPILTLFIYVNYLQDSGSVLALNQKPVMNEIISPVGSRISLELSDGTKVWLNHGSKLEYPQKFTGKTREVKLVGEGYFEVAHNPHKKFIVKTNEFNVTALGTKFNVKAYTNDKSFSTTLASGKIEVETPKGMLKMKPNQHLEFGNRTNKFNIQDVNPEKYVSWKDGKLIFEDDNFQTVAERLSRWYNVDIEIIDPEIRNLTYTATFIDEPLYQILEMLTVVTPIKYNLSDRHKLPDGTYSKRKIQVYMKKNN